jgi:hypothetical protein
MASFYSRSRPERGVISSWDQPTLVFLTVCTKNRRPWLAQARPHAILLKVWLESQSLRTHAEPSALVRLAKLWSHGFRSVGNSLEGRVFAYR